jgi:hypothetical protein
METVWIIRLRQISTGQESDSMLHRGTEESARAYALSAIAGQPDLEIANIRHRSSRPNQKDPGQ